MYKFTNVKALVEFKGCLLCKNIVEVLLFTEERADAVVGSNLCSWAGIFLWPCSGFRARVSCLFVCFLWSAFQKSSRIDGLACKGKVLIFLLVYSLGGPLGLMDRLQGLHL